MDLFSDQERNEFRDQLQRLSIAELTAMQDELCDAQTDDSLENIERARAVAKLRLVSNELELRKLGKR